jgi:Tol biopolymer transport system component
MNFAFQNQTLANQTYSEYSCSVYSEQILSFFPREGTVIGQKIGPYEVASLLGKGGMGEVYKARDTRLSRDVALKILPEALVGDSDRLARFEREAKVLASLQHQNVASIYGFEEFDGQPVLVMELAEGEDLNTRISSGTLDSKEVEKIARQMARGLEYAHEKGIVHRDLKPANVKVFGDGEVKILDFGLARAFSTVPGSDSATQAPFQPTVTQGLTAAGTVLGTAAYMSPEQARGYDVDRRSDIWAFGVILFEMLTGDRLFEGETASDTLAAILRKEPEWDSIPKEAAPLLVQICRRCLEKDPQKRMRDIGEVRVALEDSSSTVIGLSGIGDLPPAPAAMPSQPRVLPWIAVAVLAVALGAVAFLGMTGVIGPAPEPLPLVQSTIQLPEGMQLNLNPAAPGPVTVSPDGKHLAFTAIDSTGIVHLLVRDLDKTEPEVISGTDGAHYPFWSPDSRTVAFFSGNNKLCRVDIAGGPILTICPAENGKGGSWGENDQILFAPSHISSIHMVAATGGKPRDLTNLSGEKDFRSHRFPRWLPGTESFIYIAVARSNSDEGLDAMLRVGNLDGSTGKDLMPCQTSAEYANGEILFVHDAILMARPFDPKQGAFLAPARPILDGVLALPAAHLSIMSASQTGILSYASGEGGFGNSVLIAMDSDGKNEAQLGDPVLTFGLDLSHDGSRLALSLPDPNNGTFDIWILEIARNLRTRFTFDPETELRPIWSPDGQWIAYGSDQSGSSDIMRKKVSGTGSAELILSSPNDCNPTDWSPDGNLLAFTEVDSSGINKMGFFNFSTGKVDRIHPGVGYSEGDAQFSPDGKWIVYQSMETGQVEIFVESMVPEGGRWRISANGGFHGLWAPDGKTLYFWTAGGEILAVPISENASGGLQFGTTHKVTDRVEFSPPGSYVVNQVTGQIIAQRSTQLRKSSLLALVTQWQNLLPKED